MPSTGEKIRVLQVIGSMHIGGAENVVVELARGLNRSRFEVEVCCTRFLGVLAEQLQHESVPVTLAAPTQRHMRYFTPAYLDRVVRRMNPHVVHTHGTPALLHAGPLALVRRLRNWVHTFHYGNYPTVKGGQWEAEGLLCRLATRLVAVSDTQGKTIVERYGLRSDRLMTIYNGVAASPSVSDTAAVCRHRAMLGFAPEHLVVGCVAVLTEQKGVTYLLQAAKTLLNADERIRILVIGGGKLEADLRSEAASLGLGSRVVFTGWRSDAVELLPVLDIFVMSSLWEAMPMALLEAMAARRPIVVTDVGDNKAIVADGACASVIPPRNAQAIADAVLRLAQDEALAGRMADGAYQRFSERFTTRRMVEDYEALFASLAQRPRLASASS